MRRLRQARESHSGLLWWETAHTLHQADLLRQFGPQTYGPAPEFRPEDFGWDEQWTAADEAWYRLESGEAGDSPPLSDLSEDDSGGSDPGLI